MESYYSRNRERAKANSIAYYHKNKDKINERKRTKRAEARAERGLPPFNGQNRKLPPVIKNAKQIILDHYGDSCACCGEVTNKLLTVEHINNDGHKTRRQGLKGQWLYSYLIQQNFPKDIAILCFNCNIGKRNNKGECPHKSTQD